jgi:electron transport complex protein RnfE
LESAVDGLANGIGFTLALTIMGIICEFIGSGSLFGAKIMSFNIAIFSKPAGAFIVYGLCIALFTYIIEKFTRAQRVNQNKLNRENLLNPVEDNSTASAVQEG